MGEFDELDPKLRIMNFKQQVTENLMVKISKDFQKVIFTNRKEHFIIEQKYGETVQRKLFHVQGKIVHMIKEVDDGFFLLAAGDYAKSI